jgi:Xaa-Pro aminopeptidase
MKALYEGIEITPLGGQLKHMRASKDENEIAVLKKAARISEEALDAVLKKGLIGRRECDVAFDLEWEMRTRGASAASFELIVAAGPRSAMPHGTASQRMIGPDEAVVIDFGCVYRGYCSDQTVTVTTGNLGASFENAYASVYEAQERSIRALAAGVKASSIDKIARDHLETSGFGRFFGHGLGHGVGIEIHESPTVSSLSDDTLTDGMVVTIEPGVYIPGKFGIRLEDMILVTDNSCMRLTNIDKGIIKVISQR